MRGVDVHSRAEHPDEIRRGDLAHPQRIRAGDRSGVHLAERRGHQSGAGHADDCRVAISRIRAGTAGHHDGWRIVSVRAGQTYAFPSVTIAAGQTCRVYTNETHPESCGLSWRRGSAVWNNAGDRANLIDPTGRIVSTVGYGGY